MYCPYIIAWFAWHGNPLPFSQTWWFTYAIENLAISKGWRNFPAFGKIYLYDKEIQRYWQFIIIVINVAKDAFYLTVPISSCVVLYPNFYVLSGVRMVSFFDCEMYAQFNIIPVTARNLSVSPFWSACIMYFFHEYYPQ